MGQDHFDYFMYVHKTCNSFEQIDILSVERNSKWAFQVTFDNAVINCDVDDFPVLLMLWVGGLFLAPLYVLLDGLVDENFSEIALLLGIDLKIASSPQCIGKCLIILVQEVVDFSQEQGN